MIRRVFLVILLALPWASADGYVAPPWACSPAPDASNPSCPGPARGDSRCNRHGCAPDAGCAREECNAVQGEVAGTTVVQDAWLSIRGSSCKKTQWTLSECCALCQESPACNAWSYCNDPNGCGTGCKPGLHEYTAADIPVYTISPVSYTKRLNPEHRCTPAGAWPYQTCTLRHVEGAVKPDSPPLMKDAKANAGWVSGIVSKAASAEVSIASVGARPAHKQPPYEDRMRAPPQIAHHEQEEEEEEEQQDMRMRAAADAARSKGRQQQHEEQTGPEQQAELPEDSRPSVRDVQNGEPQSKAVAPATPEKKDATAPKGGKQAAGGQLPQYDMQPVPDDDGNSPQTGKQPQSQQQQQQQSTHNAGKPKHAEEQQQKDAPTVEEQPQQQQKKHDQRQQEKEKEGVRPKYDMQPVPDDDADMPKTGKGPQPSKAAAQPGREAQEQQQQQQEQQVAKPKYDMQPVPDDDAEAPNTGKDPQPSKATAKPGSNAQEQPPQKQEQQVAKPKYDMQPVPDDDADVPKTGKGPQQTKPAAKQDSKAQEQLKQQAARPKYDMQPVPDDSDAPKTGGQPQPTAAAKPAVKPDTQLQEQHLHKGQEQLKQQAARPKYDMQPVPDDDADAPNTNAPRSTPSATPAAVAAAAMHAQQGEQQAKHSAAKPSYHMQPVPDNNADAPKTGPPKSAPATAAGASAEKDDHASLSANQQTSMGDAKATVDLQKAHPRPQQQQQKPQPEGPEEKQPATKQPEQQAAPAPSKPQEPAVHKEAQAPKEPPKTQQPKSQPPPQLQLQKEPHPAQQLQQPPAEKPTAPKQQEQPQQAAAAPQQAVVTPSPKTEPKAAAHTTVSEPSQADKPAAKPGQQALSAQPAKPAATADGKPKQVPTEVQHAPQHAPAAQAVTAQQAAVKDAPQDVLVPEIAAMPLTDPEQIAAVEQARRAEQEQEAQRARQQQAQKVQTREGVPKQEQRTAIVQQQQASASSGATKAQPSAAIEPAMTISSTTSAPDGPMQAHLFTTTEFPTPDGPASGADKQAGSSSTAADVPEIAPADPSQTQSIGEPAAKDAAAAAGEEMPYTGEDASGTSSINSTAGSSATTGAAGATSRDSTAVPAASEAVDKKPTLLPAGKPIAVELDEARTLPPKKAPKRNAAAAAGCTFGAALLSALVLLVQLML